MKIYLILLKIVKMSQYKGFICQFILPSTDEYKKRMYIYDIIAKKCHEFSGSVRFTYRGSFAYFRYKTTGIVYMSDDKEDYCVTREMTYQEISDFISGIPIFKLS